MPLPPPLSADSNDRMFAVLDRASPAVDAGADPNAALAKAAVDLAMPPGHTALLVRAFNTGRAARQLAEGGDAWAKAANHPVADAARVTALMRAPEPATPDLSAYATPPRPSVKEAATRPALPPLPEAVKRAFAETPAAPRANRLGLEYKAAAAFDAAAEELGRLAPARYGAAKAAAARYAPAAAPYLFGRLEAERPHFGDLAKKAAAVRADPAFPADHPAVLSVVVLERVKLAYPAEAVPVPPPGYGPSATRPGFYERLPVCPILGVPVPPPAAKAAKAAAAPPEKAPDLILDRPLDKAAVDDGKKGQQSWLGSLMGGAASGFVGTAGKGVNWLANSPLTNVPAAPQAPKSNTVDRTRQDIDRIGDQAALQDLMTDPRFRKADPSQVLQAYREYAGLAPLAMRNPAVAGDLINRRLLTGPLGSFDLKSLTDIEHNLARISRARRGDDDEE